MKRLGLILCTMLWMGYAPAAFAANETAKEVEPFGIRFGAPLSSLKIIKKMDAGSWKVSPPTPNARFTAFYVTASEETGVCEIVALNSGFDNASDEPAQLFDDVRSTLLSIYGEPDEEVDHDAKPEQRSAPSSNIIVRSARWRPSAGGLASIDLNLSREGREWIAIRYRSTRSEECRVMIEAKKAEADKAGL